jgi:ATP-dependent protease ClpP protease subunit
MRYGMSAPGEERSDRQWGREKREDENDDGDGGIQVVGNTIWYYSNVDQESILSLNQKIRKVGHDALKRAIDENRDPAPIELRIHSYGGSMLAGIAGMESIRSSRVPITTIVEGGAASAATFLSVAGARRLITRNSYILIHQLSSFMWGKYAAFQDEMKNLDKFMQTIKNVYLERTRIPETKLEEILKHDLWFTAGESVEYGLVDGIGD